MFNEEEPIEEPTFEIPDIDEEPDSIPEITKNNKPLFNRRVAQMILIELDGWHLTTHETHENRSDDIFIDPDNPEEIRNLDKNKTTTFKELRRFYDTAFEESLAYCNRYNIDDLDEPLILLYMTAVYKLAASTLWLKYNTSVTVNHDEGIIDEGQGGKLYKQATRILDRFILSELFGLNTIARSNDIDSFLGVANECYNRRHKH